MFWRKNLIYLNCSSSEREKESFGLDGERRVRMEPWGGVAVSSTSEGTHTQTHTSSLIMSSHLSIFSVELQQTVSDLTSFVWVCGCVRVAPSSWVTFVGQGVAGQITDYCELFVCSLHLSASILDTFHTLLTYSRTICPGQIQSMQVAR